MLKLLICAQLITQMPANAPMQHFVPSAPNILPAMHQNALQHTVLPSSFVLVKTSVTPMQTLQTRQTVQSFVPAALPTGFPTIPTMPTFIQILPPVYTSAAQIPAVPPPPVMPPMTPLPPGYVPFTIQIPTAPVVTLPPAPVPIVNTLPSLTPTPAPIGSASFIRSDLGL